MPHIIHWPTGILTYVLYRYIGYINILYQFPQKCLLNFNFAYPITIKRSFIVLLKIILIKASDIDSDGMMGAVAYGVVNVRWENYL